METPLSLNFETRPPQVAWGEEQKVYLCCLNRFFERDNANFKRVFDLEFQREIRNQGFENGVPWNRAVSRLSSLRKDSDPVWEFVFFSPFDRNGIWKSIIERIETAAQVLGIHLIPKTEDDADISAHRAMPRLTPRQREAIGPQVASPRVSSQSEVIDDLPPSVQWKSEQSQRLCDGKKCFICYYEQLKVDENPDSIDASAMALTTSLPPLLYRWGNIDSQGVNSKRLFLSSLATSEKYVSPGAIAQDRFINYVSKHVHIEKFSSPFISTMRSMLTPVHRALRNKEGAIVSIIDPAKIDTQVYSARDLVCKLGIRIRGYTGLGEYLVWWKIPSSAIVCSFKGSDLEHIAENSQHIREVMQLEKIVPFQNNRRSLKNELRKGPGRLDRDTGLVIGKLLALLHVPQEYAGLVGEGIVKSWQMKQTGLWRNFVKGINEGYHVPIEGHPTDGVRPEDAMEILDPDTSDDDDDNDNDIGHNGDIDHNDSGDVISLSSGSDTTIGSPSPRQETPTPRRESPMPRVEIFNRRTQNWVDHLEDRQDNENHPSHVHNQEEDPEMLVDYVSESEDTESDLQSESPPPQDLFAIGRARVRQFFA